MPKLIIGIAISYLAMAIGVMIRLFQDNKDGRRDGFDDSKEGIDHVGS